MDESAASSPRLPRASEEASAAEPRHEMDELVPDPSEMAYPSSESLRRCKLTPERRKRAQQIRDKPHITDELICALVNALAEVERDRDHARQLNGPWAEQAVDWMKEHDALRARLAEVERERDAAKEVLGTLHLDTPLNRALAVCAEEKARADAAEERLRRVTSGETTDADVAWYADALVALAAAREESEKWKAAALDTHEREERWKKLYADACEALAAAREREMVLVEAIREFNASLEAKGAFTFTTNRPAVERLCEALLSSTPTPPAPTVGTRYCTAELADGVERTQACGRRLPCPVHGAPTVGTCGMFVPHGGDGRQRGAEPCGNALPCPRHPARKDGEG